MATKNDITGHLLMTKVLSQAYKDNYDLIFRKGNPKEDKNGGTNQQAEPRRENKETNSSESAS